VWGEFCVVSEACAADIYKDQGGLLLIQKVGRFTVNKQVVRELQREFIEENMGDKLGNLRYYGLCSPEMKDVVDWAHLLAFIAAVERGEPGKEFEDQHRLRLMATKHGFQNRLRLLCGDIDDVTLSGKDRFDRSIPYPFDIISLDYSGGLFYQNASGEFYRLDAIRKVVDEQANYRGKYVLFISANCHAVEQGEVQKGIENLRTELNRRRWNADRVCDAYLAHPDVRAQLKLYVPLYVGHIAAAIGYSSSSGPVILYEGNKRVKMVSFRFLLKPSTGPTIPRFPQERINQILNTPCIRIAKGKRRRVTLGLPKLTANDVS